MSDKRLSFDELQKVSGGNEELDTIEIIGQTYYYVLTYRTKQGEVKTHEFDFTIFNTFIKPDLQASIEADVFLENIGGTKISLEQKDKQ